MKKLDDIMDTIDESVDKRMNGFYAVFKKYFVVFSSSFLLLLIGLYFFKIYRQKPYFVTNIIAKDLRVLHSVLNKIDDECNILSVKHGHIVLDFLTVNGFAGSAIGGMNLAYPKKWQGPYLKRDLMLNGKYYELAHVRDGTYIIPGKGVKLPNKKIMGQEVQVKHYTTLAKLLEPGGDLNFKGKALAKKIAFKIGDWDSPYKMSDKLIGQINEALEEINEVLPYGHTPSTP